MKFLILEPLAPRLYHDVAEVDDDYDADDDDEDDANRVERVLERVVLREVQAHVEGHEDHELVEDLNPHQSRLLVRPVVCVPCEVKQAQCHEEL